MIKRTSTHITDTKAIRVILQQFDENWLVRNLDERDYGIDLTLERFDGESATGDFALLQVKGTTESFGDAAVSLGGFPVKTIQYSLLFNIPFFVVYVSTTDKKAYFVWLQKYAETKLPLTTPNWKSQGEVTIYFPELNIVKDNVGKIIDCIERDKLRKSGVKFLAAYESLALHSGSVTDGGQISVADNCYSQVQQIERMHQFLDRYKTNIPQTEDLDFRQLRFCYEHVKTSNNVSEDDRQFIQSQLEIIDLIKHEFLTEDDLDGFATTMGGFEPY